MITIIYNICGLRNNENVGQYIKSIESILAQKNSDFNLLVSGCKTSDKTKDILQSNFSQTTSFNFIEDILPVNITFNHSVRNAAKYFGDQDGYIYMDSGVSLYPYNDILQEITELRQENIGFISYETDVDNGELCYWRPNPTKLEKYFMPLGQTINLHFTFFPNIFYTKYENIIPDVFASYCTESVFVYLNAAIYKKWLVVANKKIYHIQGMDGGSSGFSPYGRVPHWHMFNDIRNMEKEITSVKASECGVGYEECLHIKDHDPTKFSDGIAINDNLFHFIKDTFFLQNHEFNYNNINHTFIPKL